MHRLIEDFHHAVNARDAAAAAALVTEDVEVGGPRGSGRGVELVREWASGAGITIEPGRRFGRGALVVVEQRARWAGDPEPHDIATVFELAGDRISRLIRYDSLTDALAAAGLTEAD